MKLILGLEIHLHLKTDRKMFCYCPADIYGAEPNSHTCPVCLGLPGALPVPNEDAIKKAQILGLALNCTINKNSRFDRKHYNYHDLPKGYQISQYLQPLCISGYLEISPGRKVEIERVHLEEDTAKSIHEKGKTLIDFNKSGMPLVEIVTKPVFESVEDAVLFSKKIQEIVRALGIGDVDMEKGQMRLEANISLSSDGSLPSYKVEIKNINSFKFMEKAVLAEVKRQEELFAKGETPVQENRGYDEDKGVTVAQREKEFAHDYRYFPEPDIPPMEFTEEYIGDLEKDLPQLPEQLKESLINNYKLSEKNASLLISSDLANLFGQVARGSKIPPESIANNLINKKELRSLSAEEIIKKIAGVKDLISDVSELETAIKGIVQQNTDAVENYKKGKSESLQFLIGQVMRKTSGKAEPSTVAKLLKKMLEVS